MKMKKGWQKRLALNFAKLLMVFSLGFMVKEIAKQIIKSDKETAAQEYAAVQLPDDSKLDEFPEFNRHRSVKVFVDPETGVEYLVYYEKVGYAGSGGITPRLNPDGSVRVHKEE